MIFAVYYGYIRITALKVLPQMRSPRLVLIVGLIVLTLIIILILLTAAFTPENTNPAFAVAVRLC